MTGTEAPQTPLYNTFPTISVTVTEQTNRPVVYRKSYLWDFEKGDFALDGSGRTIRVEGYNAWAQWCIKTVLTERFAYPIYSRQHGTEFEVMFGLRTHSAVESYFARTVTEALMRDRRTRAVYGFAFTWEGAALSASLTVEPTVGTPITIQVRVQG